MIGNKNKIKEMMTNLILLLLKLFNKLIDLHYQILSKKIIFSFS